MSTGFEGALEKWLDKQLEDEPNPRRKERLRRGISHSSVSFLRTVWFPAVGGFENLHAEYEVRDFQGRYRYLDFAYLPAGPDGPKGCLEIQDYRSHARDIETGRFKDLCLKHALLAIEGWLLLPVAYLSIRDDPGICKQLVLSFIGKYHSIESAPQLNWAEAETLRFALRQVRPFTPGELSAHLRLTPRHCRTILHGMVSQRLLDIATGDQRYRSYRLP